MLARTRTTGQPLIREGGHTMPPRYATAAALLAAALVLTTTGTPVQAAQTASVQAQIDAQLAKFPGGKQISATEVSYATGGFVITFTRPQNGVDGYADCPGGWFCFYEHTNYGYPRGKLSSCGWQDLSWWGWQDRTESVHNNQYSGWVLFINHSGPPDHSGDYGLFDVWPGERLPDISPYCNMADHVYRFC
jgi:hypothetical protein